MCSVGHVCSLVLFVIAACCFALNDYEGTKCQSSGTSGVCKLVKNCPMAMNELKKKHHHNLDRCGFDGFEEIVCCPQAEVREASIDRPVIDDSNVWGTENTSKEDTLNKQNRFTKRKCEIACEEFSNYIKPPIVYHIIGGEDADPGEFPHVAALGFESSDQDGLDWQRCGASLISPKFLLTAAHCFINVHKPVLKKARLGVVDLGDTESDKAKPQDYEVYNITIHPKYNHGAKHNDIALVELKSAVKMSENVAPACLYTEDDDPQGLVVSGWGKTGIGNEDDRSKKLQKAKLSAVAVNQCNNTYYTRTLGSKNIVTTQICAISNTSDTCVGDSGSALQIEMKSGIFSIVGIVSYGAGCGGKIPGVYTRVARYLDWIETVVWSD